jgi:hypothetical protein
MELIPAGHWALADAVQRVVDAAERSKDNYAAHGSALPDPDFGTLP